MFKFPNVLPSVTPLYSTNEQAAGEHQVLRKQRSLELRRNNTVAPITRCHSEDVSKSDTTNVYPDVEHFDYNLSVKIANNSKMYEPVANTCVTILTRYNEHEYASSQSLEESHCKEIKNNDNKLKASAIPEKPPRRVKLQKLNQNKKTEDTVIIIENKMKINNDEHRVDLEDINKLCVGTELNNYKNRFLSVGIQVSPLPPYRLRVLPKNLRKVKSDPEKSDCGKDGAKICCAAVVRWIFSQCGLTVIIIIWALLGAAAFYSTEGPREQEQAEELSTLQYHLAMNLATELRQVVPHEPVWLSMVQKHFAKHESLLLEAVSAGYGEGGGGGHIWTYPGCVLFAVSLLTTLGFGAPVPRTTLGRGAAVLFSAIGIPLHFLLILNVGVLVACKLQFWATKRNNQQTNSPSANSITSNSYFFKQPTWLKWLPVAAIACYYLLGVILFGFVRQRDFADSLLFPLDFTATGGVAKTLGYVRIFYALYLEVAVTLAATVVSLLQVSASRGILNLGLRLGLLTNT